MLYLRMQMKVILSAAVSLDGYLDDLSPNRLKLSSDEDWAEVKKLRGRCDTILVGAGTVRKDNPSLVIRDEGIRSARIAAGMDPDIVKVVVSRSGDLDPDSKFFTEGRGRKIVFTCCPVAPELKHAADIVVSQQITAASICAELSSRGYRSLMVEGGSAVLTMFLTEGVVDEFRLAVAPFFVGQAGAPRLVGEGAFMWNKDNRMVTAGVERLGDMTVIHLISRKMDEDRKYMRMAVEESRLCVPSPTCYCVGAVVVTGSGDIYTGYTHETGHANHAEEEAIAKALAAGADLAGATIYSTMEPCSTRSSKPRSCSRLIMDYGFGRVVYALREPACFVSCEGDSILRRAGIAVDVMDEFGPEVVEINSHLLG